ncbi:hypothetical protein T439DRAFT_368544 [Meredithblackwellia eburnea MCA 4105]
MPPSRSLPFSLLPLCSLTFSVYHQASSPISVSTMSTELDPSQYTSIDDFINAGGEGNNYRTHFAKAEWQRLVGPDQRERHLLSIMYQTAFYFEHGAETLWRWREVNTTLGHRQQRRIKESWARGNPNPQRWVPDKQHLSDLVFTCIFLSHAENELLRPDVWKSCLEGIFDYERTLRIALLQTPTDENVQLITIDLEHWWGQEAHAGADRFETPFDLAGSLPSAVQLDLLHLAEEECARLKSLPLYTSRDTDEGALVDKLEDICHKLRATTSDDRRLQAVRREIFDSEDSPLCPLDKNNPEKCCLHIWDCIFYFHCRNSIAMVQDSFSRFMNHFVKVMDPNTPQDNRRKHSNKLKQIKPAFQAELEIIERRLPGSEFFASNDYKSYMLIKHEVEAAKYGVRVAVLLVNLYDGKSPSASGWKRGTLKKFQEYLAEVIKAKERLGMHSPFWLVSYTSLPPGFNLSPYSK